MLTWITSKIKNYGIGKAIEALDNIEKPLGDKIQQSLDDFHKLDGYGIAKMMVDEIQSLLRAYFKIPEEVRKVVEVKEVKEIKEIK